MQAAAPQAGAASLTAYAGPSVAAVHAAKSQGQHSDDTATPTKPFVWATATAAEITEKCGLGGLPLNLPESVLQRFRSFLQEHEHSKGTNAQQNSTAKDPMPSISNTLPLPHPQTPAAQAKAFLPTALTKPAVLMGIPDMAATGLDTNSAPLKIFSDDELVNLFQSAPEQSLGISTAAELTAWPSSNLWSPVMPESLTFGELLHRAEKAGLELTVEEESSAAHEFLQDLEYSRAVEAGKAEDPFAPPTREHFGGPSRIVSSNTSSSTELGQRAEIGGGGMNGFGRVDFGHLLDDWGGLDEMGFRDKR
jgi:hypothetical protein